MSIYYFYLTYLLHTIYHLYSTDYLKSIEKNLKNVKIYLRDISKLTVIKVESR